MPSSHKNQTTYREEFRPLSINPTSSPDVIIPYNISVSFHNDSKSKMGDKGRETKVTSFRMRAFPWLASFDRGTNHREQVELHKEKISQ